MRLPRPSQAATIRVCVYHHRHPRTTPATPIALESSTATTTTAVESSTAAAVDSSTTTRIVASRSSVIDSLRGCGLSGVRIDKEVLRKKLVMPEYLRRAVVDAIRSKDAAEACDRHHNSAELKVPEDAPQCPMVVFINSKSGGRHGPVLK
ncbi:unnamed protein product [Linum trigynum]|uniref:DAGKc domain-containing protein n=1 Tax=Linum trigynum TaxID=586398 RepID=A0AAV2FW26_9ROSI